MRKRVERALIPPRNYRRIQPCCCANCRYWHLEELGEYYVCRRAPADIVGDWRANEPEFHVCDGHERMLEVVG